MVRVIFAGHTGLNKIRMIEVLAKQCIPSGIPKNLDDHRVEGLIRIYDTDKEIVKHLRLGSITPFIDSFDLERQQNVWRQIFGKIMADSENLRDVFILAHFAYFRFGRFFSLHDLSLLKKTFKPDLLVTLTDDIFHVWGEIVRREERKKTGSYLRLREILSWRSAELVVADMVADILGVKNMYIAMKHPTETFYKLIKTDRPIVYLCHPISKVRENEEIVNEINSFRKKLEEKCVVLSPITIDEKIIEAILKRQKEECIIEKIHRWPIETDIAEKYPIKLNLEEAKEICRKSPIDERTEIDYHLEYRDYRYIQQCDFVVAYRPFYGRQIHSGVLSEMRYAVDMFKEVLAYVPEREVAPHPFAGRIRLFESEAQLLDEVEKRRRL